MADNITHQQLKDSIGTSHKLLQDLKEELKAFATKEDLKQLEAKMATKDDLERMALRLERKIGSNQKVSVAHHLAVRDELGSLNRQVTKLREGLVQAASPH